MATFYTSRKGLFSKPTTTINNAMGQCMDRDVIEINQASIKVEQTVNMRGGITIQGDPNKKRPLIIVDDRIEGFLIDSRLSGNITFRHVAIQLKDSSYGIRCSSQRVNITLDDVQIFHDPKTTTPYLSVLLDCGGAGRVTITNSLIDILRLDNQQVTIENSNIGDWFFGGYGEGRLFMSQGSITNSALQSTSLSGHDQTSQLQIANDVFGGNVAFNGLQVAGKNISVAQLPSINHRSKMAEINADATALIIGDKTKMTINKLEQVDANKQKLPSKYKLPAWRTLGMVGGSLTLMNSYLSNTSLQNVAKSGDLTLENVTDDSTWSVEKGMKVSNRNSHSQLFKAQSKLEAPAEGDPSASMNALQKIDQMIGLKTVKGFIRQVIGQAKINAERQKRGIANSSAQHSLNMVFEGNPGTGKTAVAQLTGQALYEAGVLKSTNFVTTTQSDLVSNHVGETAMKTRDVIRKALDGVLFIDEAYQLAPPKDGGNSFNDEAVTELVKDMDAYSDRIVVIMAGYTQDMNDFLRRGNPGLKSRMQNIIEFPDYTILELKKIERLFLKDNNARFANPSVLKAMDKGIDYLEPILAQSGATGNGRFVRNYVQKITEMRDGRLAMEDTSDLNDEQLLIIENQDVQKAIDAMKTQAELTR